MSELKAPYPWFGGKARVSDLVWSRFGDVANYVEPFAGSLAVLLGRPHAPRVETVNDKFCFIANFWRALTRKGYLVSAWATVDAYEGLRVYMLTRSGAAAWKAQMEVFGG